MRKKWIKIALCVLLPICIAGAAIGIWEPPRAGIYLSQGRAARARD